jgi:segregation and condensation protein B
MSDAMNDRQLRNVLEAALLAAGRPLTIAELGQLFDEQARPGAQALRAAIGELAGEYAERGIEVKETAAGLRIQVRRELSEEISRLWPERPQRYSRALLETLALIAYRQPITRAEIESVRGVAVNPNILKTLSERGWIRVVGHRDVPGRPELLATTREFLDYFGLKALDELPPLEELRSLADLNLQLPLPGTAEGAPIADELPVIASDEEGAETWSLPEQAEDAPIAVAGAPVAAEDDGPESDEQDASPRDAHPGLVAGPPSRDD